MLEIIISTPSVTVTGIALVIIGVVIIWRTRAGGRQRDKPRYITADRIRRLKERRQKG